MKTISMRSAIAVATAATLLTSGLVPTATTAHAESVAVHGLTGKIQPKTPNPCMANPIACNPGITMVSPNPAPLPPAPPAPPAPGMNAGTAAAIGIVGGIIAGAALANAAKQKQVIVAPSGGAQAHFNWCFEKYKSYRMEDNSWQPYNGPRKPCISPYI